MNNAKKRKTAIIVACAFTLLVLLVLLFIFVFFRNGSSSPEVYTPFDYPDGVEFAEIAPSETLDAGALYGAYDPADDPAHPVLDEKVDIYISNLGSRPGEARPQDIAAEYPEISLPPVVTATPEPTSTPAVTLNPGNFFPGISPDINFPGISLPELYITSPAMPNPGFTGDVFELTWEYTGGRNLVYTVSISMDGGASFEVLVKGLSEKSFDVTLPGEPVEECVLRVTGVLDGRDYQFADTNPFEIVEAPSPDPVIVEDYVDPQVQYTNANGARISSDLCDEVWFKADNKADNAEKLVWQLSVSPFWGTRESWGSDKGIVATGEVDPALGGEFPVDIKSVCEQLAEPSAGDTDRIFLSIRSVYSFYLRVLALDDQGEPIGDPGDGIYFQYGEPDVAFDMNSASFADHSQIAILINQPYYYEWEWRRVSPGVLNRDIGSVPDRVLFAALDGSAEGSEIIQKSVQVELQVATSPFTNMSALGLAEPAGLVYSSLDIAPDLGESSDGWNYITPYFHGLEYNQFALSKEELDKLGGIYYYVRAIFYVPDESNPSLLRPYPSETITIAYRVTSASKNEVKQVEVKSHIPFVQFLRYQPVKWQDPAYDEYFEVTRHIEASEMTFSIKNCDTGEFLLPYVLHCTQFGWTSEQYQAKLDEMLPVGAEIHYVKAEEGFWDEFLGLLKAIYTAVQEAYADAKNAVVGLVDYIPLLDDDMKGYLKTAVRSAIDYGLASIGLPPSLPNLDVLAAGGLEYCLKYAVDQALAEAGVSADSEAAQEITGQVREQVARDITDALRDALLAQQQNPFGATFLRVSTYRLYEPAYVDILAANYSNDPTIGGTLGASFGNHTEIYRARVVELPVLQPGESIVVRLYLDHERNKYDGYNNYFDKIYYGNGGKPFAMHIWTIFSLPDVKQAAKDQGLSPAPLPYVTEYVFDHANYMYDLDFIPANPITAKDGAANPADFTD